MVELPFLKLLLLLFNQKQLIFGKWDWVNKTKLSDGLIPTFLFKKEDKTIQNVESLWCMGKEHSVAIIIKLKE